MKRTSQGIKGQLLEKKYKICFLSYNLMIENMFPKVKNKSSKGTVDSQRVDSLCSFSRKQRESERRPLAATGRSVGTTYVAGWADFRIPPFGQIQAAEDGALARHARVARGHKTTF